MKKLPSFAFAILTGLSLLPGARAAESITFGALTSFDVSTSYSPYGGALVGSDGRLFGYGSVGNRVWAFTLGAAAPVVLHAFDAATEGSLSHGALIEPVAGTLVGAAGGGGANSVGTIFAVNSTSGAVTVLHTATAAEPSSYASKPLLGSDNLIYVTSGSGGANANGGIVRVGLDGLNFNTVHANLAAEGKPVDGVIEGTDGRLYGTTSDGGANGVGSVFAVDKAGTTYTILHSFNTSDGATPAATVIQASGDGRLYGTTTAGGANGKGVIFSVGTDGSNYFDLHDFDGSKGATPQSRLIEDANGLIYGTTSEGGDDNVGVIFRMKKDGSVFQVLHSMVAATDGANPYSEGGLVAGSTGVYYGTAFAGGAATAGTLFQLVITQNPNVPSSPPVLKVNGPKTRVTPFASLTLKGRVSDPDGNLAHVEVKVGNRPYKTAKGVVKWSFLAHLTTGRNRVKIRAVEPGGLRSPVQRVTIIRTSQ